MNLLLCWCREYRVGNGPHEGCKFPGSCRNYGVSVLASGHELSESPAEPDLRFPSYLPDLLRQAFHSCKQDSAFPCRMVIRVRCFRKYPSDMTIAGFGNAASSGGAATGMLAGHKSQVVNQLPWRIKPDEVAKFSNGCDRDNQGDAALFL